MDYIRIAKVSELQGIRIKSFKVLARNIGIVNDGGGTFFATEISCKHQNADLSAGQLKGDILTCPRHGWTYNIRSGQCLNHDSAPLRRYALKIEGDDVFVSPTPIDVRGAEEETDALPEIRFKAGGAAES